jgi:integrase
MKKLVTLWQRPSPDGRSFTYYLIYRDENGKRRQKALGHADAKKTERQKAQFERKLQKGVNQCPMRLSEFLEDCIERSSGQVRENTILEYRSTMEEFIKVTGNIDLEVVEHNHGERFIQACLDNKNRPATVSKKIGTMKRLFQLAVERNQLDTNPFRFVKKPKSPKRQIHIFTEEQFSQLIKVARESGIGDSFRWDMLLIMALCTGMRRGELLNTIWQDIDFASKKINISPKDNTQHTWEWHIKDTDHRSVPLTDELINMLAEHQAQQPVGYPYVFIPPSRFDRIQILRKQNKWNARKSLCPMSNFRRQFQILLKRSSIKSGEFHDLRRTCLTKWFAHGLKEFDVMIMAGHSSFDTTRRFYLAVRNDLIDKTREASNKIMSDMSVANVLQVPLG